MVGWLRNKLCWARYENVVWSVLPTDEKSLLFFQISQFFQTLKVSCFGFDYICFVHQGFRILQNVVKILCFAFLSLKIRKATHLVFLVFYCSFCIHISARCRYFRFCASAQMYTLLWCPCSSAWILFFQYKQKLATLLALVFIWTLKMAMRLHVHIE